MTKKTGKRRMKKQVRKTLGALFLASAVAVAAIPTGSYDGGQAAAGIANNEDGVPIYTHVVLPEWRLGGDSANHTESYPIKSNTEADGTVTIKSIYVDSQKLGTSTDPNAILESTRIPLCKEDTTIYSTSDGYYRFAYVDSNGDQNGEGIKSAVILAYTNESSLDGGRLEIPETVDAYLNLNDNNGATTGLTAVGKSGNYLFYQTDEETEYYTLTYSTVTVQMRDAANNLLFWISYDGGVTYGTATFTQAQINALRTAEAAKPEAERKEILSTPAITEEKAAVRTYYAPCTATKFSIWEHSDLYYYPTSDYKSTGTPRANATYDEEDESGQKRVVPQLANTQAYERIANAAVYYIGNQYLDAASRIAGTITSASQGVFANNGNIGTLVISSNLVGIGDYAFYGCSVKNIEFDNGLNTIGNHAFDNCTKLTSVSIPSESNISTIGAYAFKNCQSLTSFDVPTTVRSIGDGAFKNCWNLRTIEMNLAGNRLTSLGAYVFQNCEALEGLTFPRGYTETIELSEFEGCHSLEYIKSESSVFKIVESTTCDYDWDAFKAEFNGGENAHIMTRTKFYIEAANSSPLHTVCTENEVSFKYLDEDLYELTKAEPCIAGSTGTVTYQLNGSGNLTDTVFDGPVTTVEFPSYIGPYTINKIGDGAFRDKCTLTEVRIGTGIREIGGAAFQGCHNLKYVYFDTDKVTIASDAFQTQRVTNHAKECMTYTGTDSNGRAVELYNASDMTDASNVPSVQLHFVGSVGSGSTPFAYAMNYNHNYNDSDQKLSYITYLSGWPTMLTIKFYGDQATSQGYSQLTDFPTNLDLDQYYNAEYLTDKQRAAAKAVLTTPAESRTEDQEVFYNASLSLTIPEGVDYIESGLYAKKTAGLSAFPVYCYGLKSILTNPVTADGGGTLYYENDEDTTGTIKPDPERNYFPRADKTKSSFAFAPALNEIHIYGDLEEIDYYAFQNCTNLQTVDISGSVKKIGDHAFWGCTRLNNVYIADGLRSDGLGVAPFKGCMALEGDNLSFGENSSFICENSVIYKVNDGKKFEIVEVLPNRTSSIRKTEMDGLIQYIDEEAFTTSRVKIVDLSGTSIVKVPEHAFFEANADGCSVTLPDSCTTVEPYAFEKSKVSEVSARNVIFPEAAMLDGIYVSGGQTDSVDTSRNYNVTVYAPEDSYMYKYAVAYKYTADADMSKAVYAVNFYGYNEESGLVDNLVYSTTVEDGSNLLPTEISLAEYSAVANYKDTVGYYHVLEGWQDDNRSIYTDAQLAERAITGDTNLYGNYVVRLGQSYTVSFNDYNGTVAKTYTVTEGNTLDQEEKEPPVFSDVTDDGVVYQHTGWKKSGELSVTDPITRDVTFDPIFVKKDTGLYTVTFNYIDPTSGKMVSWTQQSNVPAGSDLSKSVSAPAVDGYTFNGWDKATATPDAGDITNVTCDFMLVGTFTSNSSSGDSGSSSGNSDSSSSTTTKPGGGSNDTVQINGFTVPAYDTEIFAVALYYDANGNPYSYRLVNIGSKAPDVAKPEGYTSGYVWSPTPVETTVNDVSFFNLVPYTPSSGSSSSSSSSTTGKFYTLTVVNGSGSGSYNEDGTVIIVANDPASGQEFSNWTVEPSDTKIASKVMSATTITMPAENVTVTAHYKAKTASSTVSGNSATNNSGKTATTGTVSGGTTVVIDKNGLSNTGVVSATVKGSSDNFTIKIKESSDASTAIVKALQAEYGDISSIKYFPMDISLYDATGTKKISDTTGLSVNITLPLPDSLIPYAGNNKVAGVVNNKLDKLTPRFTTIDKVACITFTAEHFSPYVIYVDTNNATAGGQIIADNTPKTGDGIHPKWFLSLGLACVSAVLFLKRDKKTARVTTA